MLRLCVCVIHGQLQAHDIVAHSSSMPREHAMTLKTTWGVGLGKPFFLSFFYSLPNSWKKSLFLRILVGGVCFFVSVYTLRSHNRVHTNTHLTSTDGTTLHSHDRVHTNTHLTPTDGATLHSHDRVHTNTHLTPTDGTTLHSHDRVHTNTHI